MISNMISNPPISISYLSSSDQISRIDRWTAQDRWRHPFFRRDAPKVLTGWATWNSGPGELKEGHENLQKKMLKMDVKYC